MKGAKGEVVTSSDKVRRWSEYSEGLLNVLDDRMADVGYLDQNGIEERAS